MVIAGLLAPVGALGQAVDRVPTLPPVDVIHRTPLPGFDIPRSLYPGHAQQASDEAITRARAGTLPEFMNRKLVGVSVNEVQGSPFQVDINYRGQRLSPLLGTPQGLSVYLDGVRINQPFGDVMNWDLLPEAALAGISLVPGSNPLYGLNTLGGALVLSTKSGLTHPGSEIDFSVGSGNRKRLDFSHGQHWSTGSHAFVAGTAFHERGWREQSPGQLANLFLKVGREQQGTDWTASLLHARSRLTGNGLLNESLYNINRRAVYTSPDPTSARETQFSFQGSHSLGPAGKLALQAWHRRGQRHGSNGDISGDWASWLASCAGAGSSPACSDPAHPEFVDETAEFNQSTSRQRETGAGMQWTHTRGTHQIVLGGEVATTRVRHDQFSQDGFFDASRRVQAEEGEKATHEVSLQGRSRRFSVYVADAIALTPATQLTLSARWDMTRVSNELGQPAPAIAESFSYRKLNPAIGLTHAVSNRLTLFGNLSQGTRVPTSLELGCADPAQPCVLPTGLQADPYLKQVVARTAEIGVRAQPAPGLQVSAAVFRSDSRNDIVFLRSGVTQAGYFANVEGTRRQGLELALQGKQPAWDWQIGYTFLDATYRSAGVLPGPLSTESQPNRFQPGTRLAGLPRHLFKLGADWRVRPGLSLGGDWLVHGSQPIAGNEGGSRPELGRLAGYGLFHLRAALEVRNRWLWYVRVNNVLDQRYASFGAGNLDLFPRGAAVRPGDPIAAARFLAPGAPRTVVVGIQYFLDH